MGDLKYIYLLALPRTIQDSIVKGKGLFLSPVFKLGKSHVDAVQHCHGYTVCLNHQFNSPVTQPSPMLFATHHFSARHEYPITQRRLVIDKIP